MTLPERKPPQKKRPRNTKEAASDRKPSGFAAMGLSAGMMSALAEAGYLDPTPIQAGLIPPAITGKDLMGQAQTGTGKTAAFAIPILERLEPYRKGRGIQAIVLVPTRELAVQVRDECIKLAFGSEARVMAVYGGKPIRQQVEELRRGSEFVVGTPGRVMDLMDRGVLPLCDIRFVVLDEADRMLDIGFRPDIEKILRKCPASRQTLLLSATIPPPVKKLAERYMREPEMLDFSSKNLAVETIEQFYFTIEPERKYDLLIKLLQREQPKQAIVFCRTRKGTERLYQKLSKLTRKAATIHGDLAQNVRDRVMARFREGKIRLLTATDVVGRGIDVSGISHIINYDIPEFCDDYVHRVGRTGRMGREGVAFTFVSPEEGNELTRIEMRINRLLKRDEIPGFTSYVKPQPTGDLSEEETEEAAPKPPVFGREPKRYRRAL
ncbi:MAG: DEAD/DEAH box helicase [Pirellulales bacterium]|nr:DEAD/DEAH box helicase [Pirellulales bacterium]